MCKNLQAPSACSRLNLLVSGLIHVTFAIFILGFPTPTLKKLKRATQINLLDPYSKGTSLLKILALTACKLIISVTFHISLY